MQSITDAVKFLLLALFLSCSINSVMQWLQIMPNTAPAHVPAAIRDVGNGPESVKRDDMAMPEIKVDNSSNKSSIVTSIQETGNARGDFPRFSQ